MTTLRQILLPLVLVTLLAPVALADARGYVGGAGGSTVLCSSSLTTVDVAGGCDLACPTSCRVRVVDDLLEPQPFQVCDWNGEDDVNCETATGEIVHASTTGIIDVFVSVGTTGTIYVD